MSLSNTIATGGKGVRGVGFFGKLAAAVCLVLFATSLTFAQSAKGTIQGTVQDPNGAAVVGATVEATNDATHEKRTATTSDEGTYTLTNLDVGTYTLSVNGTGFAPATVKGIQVSISFTLTQDVQLGLAGASETVTVASGDAQTTVNTTDQQLSTLITQQKIQDLPLLSRDPNSLLLLAPGTNQSSSRLGGFTVNGQRERNNNFLVDGIDNNDADVPGIPGGISTPNIDATQEFRVITNNFNAEFGRNTGAIVNVATKNGTNEFHGAAYMYYRSDAFAARDFFDTTGKPNPLQRRQPGFSIGGPVRKDKTFFFFNYEHDQFDQGITVTQTVPTAAARAGIFDLTSLGFGVINASTAGSTSNRFGLAINPNLVGLLNTYVPLPNTAGEPQPLPGVFEHFRFGTQTNDKNSQISTRIDHKISEKHSLTGSYALSDGTFEFCCETFPGLNDAIRSPQTTHRLSLNLVSTFSPNVVNEFRFGGNRSKLTFAGPGDFGVNSAAGIAGRAALQSSGVPLSGPAFGGENGGLINFGIGGITSPFGFFDTQFRHAGTTQIGDSLTLIRGNHNYKTGGEFRWVYSNGASNFSRSETLNFSAPTNLGVNLLLNNAGNATLGTGGSRGTVQNFFSFLTGTVYSQSQSQFFNKNGQRTDADYRGYRQREFEVFAQDTWKVRPNLTLNYGIRYAFYGVPFEVNGQMSTLINQDPAGFTPDGGFAFELVGKNSGGRTKIYDDDLNNIAPRVGFAYSPDFKSGWMSKLTGGPGNMSIRGGYGVFYDRVFGNLFSNSSANPPFQRDFFNSPGLDCLNAGTCGSAGAVSASRLVNFSRPPTQDPTNIAVDGDFLFPVIFAQAGNNNLQNKFAMPYTQAWNFGFQRQFKGNILVEADYVGSKSTNLLRVIDGQLTSVDRVNTILGIPSADNPIVPDNPTQNFLDGVLNFAFFQVGTNVSVGMATYHAGQFRFTKNLTNSHYGLGQIQAAYTYSHSIDNAADPLDAQTGERTFPRDSAGFAGGLGAERGNSGFDVRHRFVGNMVYEIPFNYDNSVAKAVLGHWTMSGIWTWQTGSPYSIFGPTDSGGTGLTQRANYVGGDINTRSSGQQTQTGPDVTLFSAPLPCNSCAIQAVRGNVGRNAFYGPSYNNVDFSLIKKIPFGGESRYRFTLRGDFFNLFNHTNFGKPVNTIQSSNFGFSTDTFFPRRIQFSARFDF
jgi:hypothetical protein